MVAEWFHDRIWPYADSTGAGRSGIDVTNTPGVSVEVKATPGDNTGALLQAVRNAGDGLPVVVWRPNGYGPERIAQWPCLLTLADLTQLLLEAGYGNDLLAAAGYRGSIGGDSDAA
jgi:hypothetical protein